MKPGQRGDRDLMRAINRNLVLNLIHLVGPVSRSEIARQSGLGNATVSEITSELVASRLVEEIGAGESTGGRRPLLLRLNPRAGYVVGVKLTEEHLACAVTNLEANIIAHRTFPLGEDHQPNAVQTYLMWAIAEIIRASGVETSRVIGIGLGLAGVIDSSRGVVRYSPFFDWHDVALADSIAEHIGHPMYLENDVNTLTIAEQWFGYGRHVDHLAVVVVGRGIGSGIVINGQFCRSAAGELGHTTMVIDGPPCGCGKRGCLEAVASDPAVLRDIHERLAQGQASQLQHVENLNIDAVIAAADAGDALAHDALARSGRFFGIGIANLINLFSPELVIVSGEGVRAGAHRLVPMQQAIDEHVFDGLRERVKIITSNVADEIWARGAASVVLGEIFKSPILGESTLIQRLF